MHEMNDCCGDCDASSVTTCVNGTFNCTCNSFNDVLYATGIDIVWCGSGDVVNSSM